MKTIGQIKLALEGFEKIVTHVESDCSLGKVYDYASALLAFVMDQMKAAADKQAQQAAQNAPPAEAPVAPEALAPVAE